MILWPCHHLFPVDSARVRKHAVFQGAQTVSSGLLQPSPYSPNCLDGQLLGRFEDESLLFTFKLSYCNCPRTGRRVCVLSCFFKGRKEVCHRPQGLQGMV